MKSLVKSSIPTFFFLFCCVINLNCKKEYCYPDCISEQIKEIERINLPGSYISEYWFQDQIVYYIFTGYAPDITYAVINRNCEVLGLLGGFVGNKFINGEDFYKNAKLIKLVWKRNKWH
ncbi:MAG TPA: hypothetical protein VK590_03580 [Saprospiraceae bacterium]|nr:hypothetical protein [Saprospiraceae bacterium]